jgi:hypothetical protein
MSVHGTSFAVVSTGQNAIVDLPFLPDEVELSVSEQNSTENSDARIGIGFATDEYQSADAILVNSNYKPSRKYRNESGVCLVALGTPSGGAPAAVLKIAHVGFVNEGGSNKWKFNVLSYNSSYAFTISAKFRA